VEEEKAERDGGGRMKIEIPDNCGRLIDADALKEKYSDEFDDDEFCKGMCDAVDEAPTIWDGKKRKAYGEAEAERKTGKWIEPTLEMVMNRICGSDEYLCSACNTPSIDEYDFCPNCGAKMKKSEDKG
jgi:rubrerythrin